MDHLQVDVITDWWAIAATIISGILAAVATLGAVLYSNNQTKKQLIQQENKFAEERKEQYKRSKYVVVRPSLLLASFDNLLDRLIVHDDYNRVLLFSGDDGFDFFDSPNKRSTQICRLLQIENCSENDIVDVEIKTETIMQNQDNNEKSLYTTSNYIALLRSQERIIIRLTNQAQYESIIKMNLERIPHYLQFTCNVAYTTLAEQRIQYRYQIGISNDKQIEIIHDGIESVVDSTNRQTFASSPFRNLQDYISSIDRSVYSWEKMTQAQLRVVQSAILQNASQPIQHSANTTSTTNESV